MTENITVTYKDQDFDVEFWYQPEEKSFFNFKEGYGNPGCPAEIEIEEVIEIESGDSYLERFVDWDEWGTLESLVWEAMDNQKFDY